MLAIGSRACAALLGALVAGCGPQVEPPLEAERYVDPSGRFALDVPPEMRASITADGDRITFVDRRAGEAILHAEVTSIDAEAIEWVPEEQHGGDPFRAHALFRAQAWCSADGPESTQYCTRVQEVVPSERAEDQRAAIRFYPILTLEHLPSRSRTESVIGPLWAVEVRGAAGEPAVLLLVPDGRTEASPSQRAYGDAISRSIRPA